MVDTTVILAGAVPAALLALAVDGGLLFVERALSRRGRRSPRVALSALTIVAIVALGASVAGGRRASATIVVGSKNFTEQLILGELLAQTIERETGIAVDRRLNLGGTLICDRAVSSGDIDLYVEYTGTALTAVFHQPIDTDPQRVRSSVRDLYARSGRTMLAPLGFNNTFAILVRGSDARQQGLRTIADAAPLTPRWRAGFGYEFLERPDGYPGLAKAYALRFPEAPRVMDLTLSYRALASGQVDLIAGDATAGLIKGLDLFQLDDDRHYFPPYDAVVVARSATVLQHPEVRRALDRLSGNISAADMRAMNYAADAEHRDIAIIAREFLRSVR
jgi:glycine betaine/choline ABC-type transport system substrate-binding protein